MLVRDWKNQIKHAWSFRLNIVAGIFSFLEFILWFVPDWFPELPRGIFALVSFFVIIASNVMKLVSQKEFRENGEQTKERFDCCIGGCQLDRWLRRIQSDGLPRRDRCVDCVSGVDEGYQEGDDIHQEGMRREVHCCNSGTRRGNEEVSKGSRWYPYQTLHSDGISDLQYWRRRLLQIISSKQAQP